MTRLFVGNLPFTSTQEQLAEIFAAAGTVSSATVITDRATGRSRGFGFVEMSTPEEATKAVADLNGHEIDGRQIVVSQAREREERN